MNLSCPTCTRPLPDAPAPNHVGGIRFCSGDCITAWFADGRHRDRRQRFDVICHMDRRAAS